MEVVKGMNNDNVWMALTFIAALAIAGICAGISCSNYMHCEHGVMVKTMWGTYDCVPKGN